MAGIPAGGAAHSAAAARQWAGGGRLHDGPRRSSWPCCRPPSMHPTLSRCASRRVKMCGSEVRVRGAMKRNIEKIFSYISARATFVCSAKDHGPLTAAWLAQRTRDRAHTPQTASLSVHNHSRQQWRPSACEHWRARVRESALLLEGKCLALRPMADPATTCVRSGLPPASLRGL